FVSGTIASSPLDITRRLFFKTLFIVASILVFDRLGFAQALVDSSKNIGVDIQNVANASQIPVNSYENNSAAKYFGLVRDLQKHQRVNLEQLADTLLNKLTQSQYSAIMFGEEHDVEGEDEVAAYLINRIAQTHTIGRLLVEGVEGSKETIITLPQDFVIPAKHIKRLDDPFSTTQQVVKALRQLQGNNSLLITYTGSGHTDSKIVASYPEIWYWGEHDEEHTTVREAVKQQQRNSIVIITLAKETLLDDIQNALIRDFDLTNPEQVKAKVDNFKRAWEETVEESDGKLYFVQSSLDGDVYFGYFNTEGTIGHGGLDLFEMIWGNQELREIMTEGGYQPVYAHSESGSVYFKNAKGDGIKFLIKERGEVEVQYWPYGGHVKIEIKTIGSSPLRNEFKIQTTRIASSPVAVLDEVGRLILETEKAMPYCFDENPDWSEFNNLVERIRNEKSVVGVLVVAGCNVNQTEAKIDRKFEIKWDFYHIRARISNNSSYVLKTSKPGEFLSVDKISVKENEFFLKDKTLSEHQYDFLAYILENINQHVDSGIALVVIRRIDNYLQISVMDNGTGFMDRNGNRISTDWAIQYGRSFGMGGRYGRGLTKAVGREAHLSIIEQPKESPLPGRTAIIASKGNFRDVEVYWDYANRREFGTKVVGYFYPGHKKVDKWRDALILQLKQEIMAASSPMESSLNDLIRQYRELNAMVDWRARLEILQMISSYDATAAEEILIEALGEFKLELQNVAVSGLIARGVKITDRLVNVSEHGNVLERENAMKALSHNMVASDKAMPLFINGFTSNNAKIRKYAIEGVINVGVPAISMLAEALNSNEADKRLLTAWVIAKIASRNQEVQGVVSEMLNIRLAVENDWLTARGIRMFLKKIGVRPFEIKLPEWNHNATQRLLITIRDLINGINEDLRQQGKQGRVIEVCVGTYSSLLTNSWMPYVSDIDGLVLYFEGFSQADLEFAQRVLSSRLSREMRIPASVMHEDIEWRNIGEGISISDKSLFYKDGELVEIIEQPQVLKTKIAKRKELFRLLESNIISGAEREMVEDIHAAISMGTAYELPVIIYVDKSERKYLETLAQKGLIDIAQGATSIKVFWINGGRAIGIKEIAASSQMEKSAQIISLKNKVEECLRSNTSANRIVAAEEMISYLETRIGISHEEILRQLYIYKNYYLDRADYTLFNELKKGAADIYELIHRNLEIQGKKEAAIIEAIIAILQIQSEGQASSPLSRKTSLTLKRIGVILAVLAVLGLVVFNGVRFFTNRQAIINRNYAIHNSRATREFNQQRERVFDTKEEMLGFLGWVLDSTYVEFIGYSEERDGKFYLVASNIGDEASSFNPDTSKFSQWHT
ncbi:MAG: hypothetical protein PHG69_00010, partial [Candidatus Omnitrophica bacterium]|nr:hypothetical protein [Candidatus Omnitrophota bacterium]